MAAAGGAGGAGVANVAGAVLGVATSLATGILTKKGLYKQAKWMRRRGRVAARVQAWESAAIRGAIRASTQDRAAGDTVHIRLAQEIANGLQEFEAKLPYEIARGQLRLQGQQELLEGVKGAVESVGQMGAGLATGGPGGRSIKWSEMLGALGIAGNTQLAGAGSGARGGPVFRGNTSSSSWNRYQGMGPGRSRLTPF